MTEENNTTQTIERRIQVKDQQSAPEPEEQPTTTITIEMFRMWLQGVEEMQKSGWHPTAAQWKTIREKIEQIADAPTPAPIREFDPGGYGVGRAGPATQPWPYPNTANLPHIQPAAGYPDYTWDHGSIPMSTPTPMMDMSDSGTDAGSFQMDKTGGTSTGQVVPGAGFPLLNGNM